MGTCLRWCGTGIGFPRPRATSPFTVPIDRSLRREAASINRFGDKFAVVSDGDYCDGERRNTRHHGLHTLRAG